MQNAFVHLEIYLGLCQYFEIIADIAEIINSTHYYLYTESRSFRATIFIDEHCFSFFIALIDKSLDENKESKMNEIPAQDKFTETLNVLNEFIASLFDLEKKIGLTSERKLILNHLWKREATKKKLKHLKSLVKSQQKSRSKRKQVVKELARDHPKIGYKLKKTSSKKATRAT